VARHNNQTFEVAMAMDQYNLMISLVTIHWLFNDRTFK